MSPGEDDDWEGERPAWEKTYLPGSLLIFVGVLNFLAGIVFANLALQTLRMTSDQVTGNESAKQLRDLGYTPEQIQTVTVGLAVAWSACAFGSAVIVFYAGLHLRSLNFYRFALIGSILAAVPGVSPASCLGIGVLVGIWGLVVLLDPKVRAAFQRAEMEADKE